MTFANQGYKHIKRINVNQIAFLGLGNMAKKMALRIGNKNNPKDLIQGYSPSQRQIENILTHASIKETLNHQLKYVIYAFKPKNWNENLKKEIYDVLQKHKERPIIVSILAGLGIEELDCDIVVMPNMLCEVGHSFMFAHARDNLVNKQKLEFEKMCENMGPIFWVNQASQMHMAVASSGSAPAYILFAMDKAVKIYELSGLSHQEARHKVIYTIKKATELLKSKIETNNAFIWDDIYKELTNNNQLIFILRMIEAYCNAMQELGLDIKTTYQVAWHTVFGTALLVESHPELEINTIIESIMSKGGTTERAIAVAKTATFDIFSSQETLNKFMLSMLKAAYDQSIFLKEQSKKKPSSLEGKSIFKEPAQDEILNNVHIRYLAESYSILK